MEKNGFKVFFSRTTVGQFQPNLTGIEFVCMTWCITCGTNDIPRYKHSLLKTIFLFNYNNDCTLLLTITYNAGNACADPEKFVLMLGSIAPTCPCKSTHCVFKRGGVTVHVLYCLYLAMYFLEYMDMHIALLGGGGFFIFIFYYDFFIFWLK